MLTTLLGGITPAETFLYLQPVERSGHNDRARPELIDAGRGWMHQRRGSRVRVAHTSALLLASSASGAVVGQVVVATFDVE